MCNWEFGYKTYRQDGCVRVRGGLFLWQKRVAQLMPRPEDYEDHRVVCDEQLF